MDMNSLFNHKTPRTIQHTRLQCSRAIAKYQTTKNSKNYISLKDYFNKHVQNTINDVTIYEPKIDKKANQMLTLHPGNPQAAPCDYLPSNIDTLH